MALSDDRWWPLLDARATNRQTRARAAGPVSRFRRSYVRSSILCSVFAFSPSTRAIGIGGLGPRSSLGHGTTVARRGHMRRGPLPPGSIYDRAAVPGVHGRDTREARPPSTRRRTAARSWAPSGPPHRARGPSKAGVITAPFRSALRNRVARDHKRRVVVGRQTRAVQRRSRGFDVLSATHVGGACSRAALLHDDLGRSHVGRTSARHAATLDDCPLGVHVGAHRLGDLRA